MRLSRRGLWQHPDFLKLWTGQTVSVFGTLITRTALPFAAILTLDATPFQVALLGASDIVAGLLVGLFAGVWVDRLRRRPLMIASDLLRALLLLSVPAAALLDVLRVEQLYAVAFLTGTLTILFDIAYQSYLPTLVRREELLEGNSKLTASASVAEFGAFSLGGWLVQLLTAPFAIVIDALTFLVSAAGVALIRAPEPPPVPREQRGALRRELTEGMIVVGRDPVLRALALSTVTEALARGIVGAVILLYLTRGLGFSPGVLGLIFGIGGISSLAGALAAERITSRFGLGRTLTLSLVVMGAGTMLVPLAGDASWFALALLAGNQLITDPAATVNDIAAVSLRQARTPERLLGRVTAAVRFAAMALTLAAMLGSGLLAERIGLRSVLAAGASIYALAALWLFFSPVRRLTGIAEAPPDAIAGPAVWEPGVSPEPSSGL